MKKKTLEECLNYIQAFNLQNNAHKSPSEYQLAFFTLREKGFPVEMIHEALDSFKPEPEPQPEE